MADNNKISDIIATALDNIKNVLDADTVIGTPIATDNGTTVIPVSRVSMGLATGGLDLPEKKKGDAVPSPVQKFGGGTGTGISVSPIGFLVIKPNGDVELLNINNPMNAASDPVGQVADLIERSPEIVGRFKELFPKKTPEQKAADRAAKQEKQDKE